MSTVSDNAIYTILKAKLSKYYIKDRLEIYKEPISIQNTENQFIKNFIRIDELLKEQKFSESIDLWNRNYQKFEQFEVDVVLLEIYVLANQLHNALEIKIHWHKTLDKINFEMEGELIKNYYNFLLGILFENNNEFEISSAFYKRSIFGFTKLQFDRGIKIGHYKVSEVYSKLGAFGDSRYHIRELISRNLFKSTKELFDLNVILLDLYYKSGNLIKFSGLLSKMGQLVEAEENVGLNNQYKDLLIKYEN